MNVVFDSLAHLTVLRRRVDRFSHPRQPNLTGYAATGHKDIDHILGGGFSRSKLHEIIAISTDHAVNAAGFAAMCAQRFDGMLAWLRLETGDRALHPHGLHEIGVNPGRCLLVSAPDSSALLRAADEALRCTALTTVVIELWREPQRIDLTVSRRLQLAAERSGVTALLLRVAVDPVPTAAQTRWAVSAAPSQLLATGAPGWSTLDLELLRQRGGPAGMRWRVEWNRDETCFKPPFSGDLATLPGSRSLDHRRHRPAA